MPTARSELTTSQLSSRTREGDYAAPDVSATAAEVEVAAGSFVVELPPGTQIELTIGLERNVAPPSYASPF